MRNASGHQGENEQQQKKVNSTPYSISSIEHVTRKFYIVVMKIDSKEMYKKVCCTCKVVFLLIRPTVFWLFFLLSPLNTT